MAKLMKQSGEWIKEFDELIKNVQHDRRREYNRKIDKLQNIGFFGKSIGKPLVNLYSRWHDFKTKMKGNAGEKMVKYALESQLSDEYYIFSNVVLKAKDGQYSQFDHIVVSQYGLYVIETKNWKGVWYAVDDKFMYKKQNKWVYVKSPVAQNRRHVDILKQYISADVLLKPVIVFTGTDQMRIKGCTMPVLVGADSLVKHIQRDKHQMLSIDSVHQIVGFLSNPIIYMENNRTII